MHKLNKKILKIPIVVASFVMPVFMSENANAADCNGVQTFFDWGCDPSKSEQLTPLFLTIFNWLAVGVSIAVVGGIIYGAIVYTTAGGAPERAKKGIDIIRNAVIALVLYYAMFSLLNFLVPGGLFT